MNVYIKEIQSTYHFFKILLLKLLFLLKHMQLLGKYNCFVENNDVNNVLEF
jgi:hypothetical protein